MKHIDDLQANTRRSFSICGSLIIHFILFVALAFSGIFAMQSPTMGDEAVVFLDAGGGGGGGDTTEITEVDGEEEQVEDVVEEETITLPDGRIEHKQVVKHVPAGAKKVAVVAVAAVTEQAMAQAAALVPAAAVAPAVVTVQDMATASAMASAPA